MNQIQGYCQKIMLFHQRIMYGRYGMDQYGVFLLICATVCTYLAFMVAMWPFYVLRYLPLAYVFYRFFSKDIPKRRLENKNFLRYFAPYQQWFKLASSNLRDRQHKYFHCPKCKQKMRIPRGKGIIMVTCSSCHHIFREKS